MIKLDTFFEPKTLTQKLIKWTAITLIILIGLGMFLFNLMDAIAQEQAYRDPINVQATVTIAPDFDSFYYASYCDAFLSYEYQGKSYKDIYYITGKNARMERLEGTVITVSLNPNDPSMPANLMVNDFYYSVSVVVLSFGIAMVMYGIALECHAFRQWRIEKSKKKSLFSFLPDYLKDVFFISLAVYFLFRLVLALVFPYRYGLVEFFTGLFQ